MDTIKKPAGKQFAALLRNHMHTQPKNVTCIVCKKELPFKKRNDGNGNLYLDIDTEHVCSKTE